MAKVSHGTSDFYDQVSDSILAHEKDWSATDPRNIATVLYSLALAEEASQHDAAFRRLASVVCARRGEFMVQGLTNAVWSYATACYAEPMWFSVVADDILQRRAEEFEALDVANCLWSFASVAFTASPNTISHLKNLGSNILSDFTAQNLAISLWSLAALEWRDETFFSAAADHFVQRLSECKAQELNNALWACATAGVRLPWLFVKAANHAMSIGLEDFKMHELSIMLWAHGTAGVCNHAFFDKVVDEVLHNRGINSCTPREVANSAWAYSTIIGRCHMPWMTAVASFSCQHISEFDMQGLGNVLWAFANVAIFSEPLLRVACVETSSRLISMPAESEHNVAQVLSAARSAGYIDVALLENAAALFTSPKTEIGARELLILCNAALPASNKMASHSWDSLEMKLRKEVLEPLIDAIPPREVCGEAAWAKMENCVAGLDLDHLGVFYTAKFLKEVGAVASVKIAGEDRDTEAWIHTAATSCNAERERAVRESHNETAPAQQQKLGRQLDKVNKREIVAWFSYEVEFPSGERRQEAGRAISWRLDAEERAAMGVASPWLRPLTTRSRVAPTLIGEHDRSGHAERCALVEVASGWLEALGVDRAKAAALEGSMCLYVTHFPCISCSCVIAQFSRLFPRLQLHVAFADARNASSKNVDLLQ
eukprot:TRINITY_DN12501_c3_g1_i1.p1 TRINITY_DN12501_c3_g1~~TRINITY_DN12501_c3_g1_i1.p1  ORF type:complete len:717 (+),score=122.57 TRINITY_DN12501_c3_g1_i1:179-2152(+)